MRRKRLVVVLALGLVGAILVVLLLLPAPPVAEHAAAPPVPERRKPALQADAEGHYVPGYPFTVNRVRFTGFTLRPDALVTFAPTTGGGEEPVACLEAVITADAVHLRCDDPQLGSVTVDGRFLTRVVTKRLDAAVVSAVVTVRSGSGEILYRARDSFDWHPPEGGDTVSASER
jgi:hypothetical protein